MWSIWPSTSSQPPLSTHYLLEGWSASSWWFAVARAGRQNTSDETAFSFQTKPSQSGPKRGRLKAWAPLCALLSWTQCKSTLTWTPMIRGSFYINRRFPLHNPQRISLESYSIYLRWETCKEDTACFGHSQVDPAKFLLRFPCFQQKLGQFSLARRENFTDAGCRHSMYWG